MAAPISCGGYKASKTNALCNGVIDEVDDVHRVKRKIVPENILIYNNTNNSSVKNFNFDESKI